MSALVVNADFPPKLEFLFRQARYKVARGGRGSGKSWSFARAILIKCLEGTIRVLCTREIQKSIQQSVHQLLVDQIELLGLQSQFEILQTEIRSKRGSQIFFSGLSDVTAASLKSFEGVDICWCEEAQTISEKSWKTLVPTIRKEGSEIWVTYNPELESDPTHQRFVINPPPDCVSVLMNWSDNPWFPGVLDREREHAKATMRPEDYAHVWEGMCKPAVEGAIYFDQMSRANISLVPHDAMLKTHVVFDLGFNDAMSIAMVQKSASEIRIINYIEGTQRTLADYSAELRDLTLDGQRIQWGDVWLPHDGFAKRHQTGKTDADIMRQLGWSVMQTPNLDVEQGINRARESFPRIWFHKTRTERLIECLKRYRRQVSQVTGEPGRPLHDEFSHGADCFRYLCINSDAMTNEDWGGKLNYPRLSYA